MSNKTATAITVPEPLDQRPLPIRIRHVRFVTKGTLIANPREAEDHVAARKPEMATGYDIWLVPERRAFRFDRYEAGRFVVTKWMPESRIESFECDDAETQPNSAA